MAEPEKRRRPKKAFAADVPLDGEHLREWVEHLAEQLVDSDSVEVTLIQQTPAGRSIQSLRVRAPYYGRPCPGRVAEPPPDSPSPPPPDSESHPG
jgi:hypothetical protein